ncbi:Signal peptidase I T [Actinoplanes sp. SE50]|uniref:S26 family signal peptidase n=1 Tax=unclassified Actinoplanes TaxID=2626549 RepID=UPI00023ED31F|nr:MULTISPECIES: S26 family signal peptidase [unclassified Actinoplanes]AEV87841.1 Signal peptidase I T [Actinoplanes sp. SE50/110]ATO86243.1 Signal peptidase I T [Actinoplanes sp. SE50]SLM03658.1 Signal peptidase I T [Actinoplanes sp. SE50/110]
MWWLAVLAVPLAVAAAARAGLRVVEVRGHSMNPAYADGDRILVRRGRARTGRPVVFRRPDLAGPAAADVDWLVKRVVATAGQPVPQALAGVVPDAVVPPGRLLVRGDNPHSIDSRHFGYVAEADVLGVAIRRLSTGTGVPDRAVP